MKKIINFAVCLFIGFYFICCYPSSALAISAGGTWTHSAWSSDFGIKAFTYKVSYYADTKSGYEVGQTYDAAYNHDYIAYKTPSDYIYPPEVGNGDASVVSVSLVDSSNNIVNTLSNSSWSRGTLRSYIWPEGTIFFDELCTTHWLQGFPSSSYRVKVVSGFALDVNWVPNLWTSDTCYTSTF